ncbi:MAG: sugar transferase [Clostridia bacterium]|jgi:lipopolysaccharide/colanic/teichoic acid biosynthesis glycosyltransferase|nr:sugar transferase [Clostridia bacterium]MCI8980453.1 sugar transferase [Clostridia bacterium]MCI9086684.1 sugar transferase [Clostridia bacterium]
MLLQEEREQVIITAEDLNRPVYEVFKRVLDFVLSLFALVILLPVFLITAAAVKSDGGNVIYKQKRVGKNNKLFDMYKFRSMCIGAENMRAELMKYNEMDGPVFKIKNDPRITKVGKFIRKYSIDELPQLVNILKGDMSIVGPRPPLLDEVAQYTDYHRQRLMVTPGLTCFWQAYGRSDLSFEDWVDMDMKYIKRRSISLDISLIIRTVYAVIFKRGAY